MSIFILETAFGNMDELDESTGTLWRSLDSSLEMADALSADASFRSLAASVEDPSEMTAAERSPGKVVNLEAGLLDALKNLQIASVRKTFKFRPPMMTTHEQQEPDAHSHLEETLQTNNNSVALNFSQSVDDAGEIEKLVKNLVEQVHESNSQSSIADIPKKSVIDDKKETGPENDKTEKPLNLTKPTIQISVAPEILDNMKKAVKPLLKPPSVTRKVTKGISPNLQTKSRGRVTASVNPPMTNDQTKKPVVDKDTKTSSSLSSSVKRQTTKHTVATVVSTKEGITVKEEKISNFGIPIARKTVKKRTQAIPFSFATRGKSTQQRQQEPQKGQEKLPMRDSNAGNQLKQPIVKPAVKKVAPKLQITKIQTLTNRDESINKENSSITLNRLKPAVGGLKLPAGNRLKERRELDEKVKQRQKEAEEKRAQIELKKMEPRANGTAFRIPAPVRSKKPVPAAKAGK